jgi:DNA ligase-1
MKTCVVWLLLLIGSLVPGGRPAHAQESAPPRLMLAKTYTDRALVADYWISEKLDGVRGRWDGRRLHTRGGHLITPPKWFTAGWPAMPMDGELWMGHGRFDEVSGLVRAGDVRDPKWQRVRFMVFDLPAHGGAFDARVMAMRRTLDEAGVAWLQPVPQFRLQSARALDIRLQQVVASGGEGLMLHHRQARYLPGRSDGLLKLKPYTDAEATVVSHLPGRGKYLGKMGALLVEQSDGRQFRLGSGFTDAQRARPPPPGSHVTYRYNGLTRTGLPRFARFMRVRKERPPPDPR